MRVRVEKSKRSYAEAAMVELLEPSADRIPPRAPHPGAPWQVLPYGLQLAEKERQVRDTLVRLGRFDPAPVEPIVAAAAEWRYRNKLEYSFGRGDDGELVLGFHRPGRWNEVDDVQQDILASERVDGLREAVREWCRSEGLSAYDRRSHQGLLRNLVVREGRRTGQLQARLVTSPGRLPVGGLSETVSADGLLLTRAAGVAETTREGTTEVLAGSAQLEEELQVAGRTLRFRISPEAFFQTNTEMAERLYGVAAELAGLRGAERVLDLFCGIGTIALALASSAREVIGLELLPRAVEDAAANAELNGIANARFLAGDVRTALRPLIEREGSPDVVVLDPPRAGLSQKEVRRVLEAGASRVVYVSCNPTTLAPNARQMADAGYELRNVRPVDMFPQTPHIECVALLER